MVNKKFGAEDHISRRENNKKKRKIENPEDSNCYINKS